jgi:hypothetical protein
MKRGEDTGRRETRRDKGRDKGRDEADSWMEGRGDVVKERQRGLTTSASLTGSPRDPHRLKLTSDDGAIGERSGGGGRGKTASVWSVSDPTSGSESARGGGGAGARRE